MSETSGNSDPSQPDFDEIVAQALTGQEASADTLLEIVAQSTILLEGCPKTTQETVISVVPSAVLSYENVGSIHIQLQEDAEGIKTAVHAVLGNDIDAGSFFTTTYSNGVFDAIKVDTSADPSKLVGYMNGLTHLRNEAIDPETKQLAEMVFKTICEILDKGSPEGYPNSPARWVLSDIAKRYCATHPGTKVLLENFVMEIGNPDAKEKGVEIERRTYIYPLEEDAEPIKLQELDVQVADYENGQIYEFSQETDGGFTTDLVVTRPIEYLIADDQGGPDVAEVDDDTIYDELETAGFHIPQQDHADFISATLAECITQKADAELEQLLSPPDSN